MLGVRTVEATTLRPGGPGRGLRRRGHRAQPRRQGSRAVRQHPAMGHRLPRPPAPGAAGDQRVSEEGEATGPPDRARDGGVVSRAGNRLRGRGMPDRCRQQAPLVQGIAERHRGQVTRCKGIVLPRASSSAWLRCWPGIPLPRQATSTNASGAGRPRRGRSVRSVGSSRSPLLTTRFPWRWCWRRDDDDDRSVRNGGEGTAARLQEASVPDRIGRRRRVPQPQRLRRPHGRDRSTRGRRRSLDEGLGVHRAASHTGGLRGGDAAAARR